MFMNQLEKIKNLRPWRKLEFRWGLLHVAFGFKLNSRADTFRFAEQNVELEAPSPIIQEWNANDDQPERAIAH